MRAGRKRAAEAEVADRDRAAAGEEWKLQRVRSLSSLPSDESLLAQAASQPGAHAHTLHTRLTDPQKCTVQNVQVPLGHEDGWVILSSLLELQQVQQGHASSVHLELLLLVRAVKE